MKTNDVEDIFLLAATLCEPYTIVCPPQVALLNALLTLKWLHRGPLDVSAN